METQITNNWIDRYSDNDLSESERQLFQLNLQRNSLLRKELLIDVRLNQFLEDPDTIELMYKIRNITRKPYLAHLKDIRIMAAASVFCLIFLGVSYLIINRDPGDFNRVDDNSKYKENQIPEETGNPVVTFRELKKNSSATPVSRRILALKPVAHDLFTPITEYESLVGAVTRSSGVLVSSPLPELKTHLNLSVPFVWEGSIASDTVSIVIINNHGTSVQTSQHPGNIQKYLLETDKLGRGLFYWKILVNDELIVMGRIIIE
jgi:hypothetical protein